MAKEYFQITCEKILGDEYLHELNEFCIKRTGKDLNNIGWRDRTSWIGEMSDFLKENFNIGFRRKVHGVLGGWCHGATMSKNKYEIVDLSVEETITEDIPKGIRISMNPKHVLKEITVSEDDLHAWLESVKAAMDVASSKFGVQKTLVF